MDVSVKQNGPLRPVDLRTQNTKYGTSKRNMKYATISSVMDSCQIRVTGCLRLGQGHSYKQVGVY